MMRAGIDLNDLRDMERRLTYARRVIAETMELIALGRAAIRQVWTIIEPSTSESDRDGER